MRAILLLLVSGCAAFGQIISGRHIATPTLSTSTPVNIGTPALIGTNSVKAVAAGAGTVSITVGSGVAIGVTVLVSVATDPGATSLSVTDSRGNTYVADIDISNGSNNSGARALVYRSFLSTALQAADTITFAWTNGAAAGAAAIGASSVTGLDASPVDQTKTATGSAGAPDTGSASSTIQATELLWGVVAGESSLTFTTYTAGSGYTKQGDSYGDSGASSTSMSIIPEYQAVSSTGTYSATWGRAGTARTWAAALVTYK